MDRVERVLQNLQTVGAMAPNDRLYTRSDAFSISSPSMTQTMLRMLYRESRAENLDRVRELLHSARNECELILLRGDSSWQARHTFDQLVAGMVAFQVGMQQLRETYHHDASACSQISIIVDDAKQFVAHAREQWVQLARPAA